MVAITGILAVCNGEVNASVNNGDTTLNIDNNKNIRTEPVLPDISYIRPVIKLRPNIKI